MWESNFKSFFPKVQKVFSNSSEGRLYKYNIRLSSPRLQLAFHYHQLHLKFLQVVSKWNKRNHFCSWKLQWRDHYREASPKGKGKRGEKAEERHMAKMERELEHHGKCSFQQGPHSRALVFPSGLVRVSLQINTASLLSSLSLEIAPSI